MPLHPGSPDAALNEAAAGGQPSTPEAANAQIEQDAVEGIGANAPAAAEPLDAKRVNRLIGAVDSVVKAMSGGDIEAPPVEKATGTLDQVPPALFTSMAAIDQFLKQAAGALPDAAEHSLDLDAMMSTNDGLDEALMALSKLESDKALMKAIAQSAPPPEGEAPAEEAAPAPEEEPAEKGGKFDNII